MQVCQPFHDTLDPEEDHTERHQHGDPDLSRSFD
jgi:hypothetical protein